ncbi:MAG: hypothetical protein P8L77_03185 [Gammaproteobacteria bacterium]|nr:hypothetical protein [Gammaproteobacteria bacterium]
MPNSITIHDSFISIINNQALSHEQKIELFVQGIDSSATINNELKKQIESYLNDLNAQTNTDSQTGSELFETYFPNLIIEENVEAVLSVANTPQIEESSSIEIEHPIDKKNSIEADETFINGDVSFIEEVTSDDDSAASFIKEANKSNESIPEQSASTQLTTPFTNEFGDQTSQVNQIFDTSKMTHNDLTEELKEVLSDIYSYIELFPHKYIKTLLNDERFVSLNRFQKPIQKIINVQSWIKSLVSYSTDTFKNKEDPKGIIFIIKTCELLFEGSSHKRELMLLLYLSIITQPITIQKVAPTTEIGSYNEMLFKDHYPALYSDINSDTRFKDIINFYETLYNLKYSNYPDNEYHTGFSSFSIKPTLCIVAGLILAFVNILPMIPTIGILGSSLFILNIKRNYDINNEFKKEYSMFDNTGRTTKTFRINLILTSLLIIATTSAFVSLVLNSYPMIALLTGAFCMTVSLTLNKIFCESSYAKLSKSLIENHEEKIKQNSYQFKSLINDFVDNPNQSSTFKTSDGSNPETPENNNPLLINDRSLFGSTQQTRHLRSNAGFDPN